MLILHISLVFQILHYLKFDVSAHPISLSKNLVKRECLEAGVSQSHSVKSGALKEVENFTQKSRKESTRGASNSIKLQVQAPFGKENKNLENSVQAEGLTDLHEFTNSSQTSKQEGKAKGAKIVSVGDTMGKNELTNKDSRTNSGNKMIIQAEISSLESRNLEMNRFQKQENKTIKNLDPLKGISVQSENCVVEDFLRRIETNNHRQGFTGGYAAALRYIHRI
ncbi:hypothetical protein PGT21_031223 [Puccinia graminis f. sp. tritici]|uniref:Uncharacterized protein n=1 Tax=Puccinia graminis f. sp. tritici TaxID=56615 RepID=A0A5B0QCP2_PUCGR|nr:hypothetical protein PGT21_031223 [Puccinia graminis f. sp. tritici]